MSKAASKEHFVASDGFKIVFRHWKGTDPKRVVLCIHGLGDHSGWFSNIAPELAEDGNEVYALDLRGFGESIAADSQRGVVSNFERHLQDIDDFVQYIRGQNKGKALFLLGHSLGGVYSIWYAANHPLAISGLVLAAPAVACNITTTYSDKNRDPEEITIMQNDPLETWALTQNYLSNVQEILLNNVFYCACRVEVPTLVLQGSVDVTVLPHGARQLESELAVADKELVIVDGAGHWFFDALSPALPRGKCDTVRRAQFVDAIKVWLRCH